MKKLRWLAAGMVVGCGVGLAQPGVPAAPAAGAATQEIATPAIWRVKGAHGTVYLFGTVHMMKPEVVWETGKVKDALAASGVLYLEIANMDDMAAAQPVIIQAGLDTAHPLSSKLSPGDVALLDTEAKEIGLPGEQAFEAMRPWLVSATLSVLPMVKAGYGPATGIDMKLLAEAKAEQKQVLGFETMEQQMHMLADVPEADQVKELHRDLAEMDKQTAETNELVAAWEKGDVERIGKIDNDELAAKYPAEYKRVVVDRNARWAATLDGLLKDPGTGTVFVAVGAAHLAGPDSVIRMLEKDGWTVERE